jgi:hypothetical protein
MFRIEPSGARLKEAIQWDGLLLEKALERECARARHFDQAATEAAVVQAIALRDLPPISIG